ncbi:MAG: acyl carrier protein [Mycobacteriaceae bacterium]|nr:acyl carrier protein [Mycobacteriaceae bacterium]
MTDTSGPVDLEELRHLVAGVLELPAAEVADHADLADELDLDSLAALELATRLQDRYRVAIPDSEIAAFGSLARVRELLDRLLGGASQAADVAPAPGRAR